MALLSKCLVLPLIFLSSLAFADEPSGLSYSHQDWELACDNTRTCRAAGYHSDYAELRVSVLLTRKAGPNQPVTGQLMISPHGENFNLDSLPSVFKLSLRINERPVGRVRISKPSLVADLTPKQVTALLAALARESYIELTTGEFIWVLSDKGAAAVLLKMDEFQGRIGTPGALVKRGAKDEKAVLPAVQVPVVIAASLPKSLPGDQLFVKKNSIAIKEALHATLTDDDCLRLHGDEGQSSDLTATRLSDTKILISAQCWMGAYNVGYGFWVINSSPPYRPILVTTSGSDHSNGTISASQKRRGLGDCWSSDAWTWDGRQFVHTKESSTGMCKLMNPGGAWSLPTIVTEVRPAAQGK